MSVLEFIIFYFYFYFIFICINAYKKKKAEAETFETNRRARACFKFVPAVTFIPV